MQPLDDELEALLAEEMEGGGEEMEGGHKRRLDLASRADAARTLAEQPVGGAKRPRVAGGLARQPALTPAEDANFDDDELLAALAQGSEAPFQSPQPTLRGLPATEEQALVALAGGPQPSQSVLGAAATTTAAGRGSRVPAVAAGTAGMLAASEEQNLVDLAAAGTQPSQMPAGASRAAWQRSSRAQLAVPAGGGDDDFDPMDELDSLLEMEADDGRQLPAAAAQHRTLAAAAQHRTPAPAAQPVVGAAARAASPPAAAVPEAAPVAAPQPQPAPELLPRRQYVPPAKEVFRINGASLACTSESGERVYCAVEAVQQGGSRRADMAGWLRRARGTLLSEPIGSLLAAVEQDQYERALAETAAAATAPDGQQRTPVRRRSGGGAGGASGRASLWVQKYAPKAYIDLLSDEQINREVVRWLKGWDPAVFGTAAPAQVAREARGMGSRFEQQQIGQTHGGSGGGSDPLGRPEHKVLLIAGPPGLGKTTLAHVCAAHCGYRPLEINASDDRGGASLQARILNAVEMQSVMGERRPNCVIIDEIDGATGGTEGRSGIAALLNIVTAGPSKGKQQGGSGKGHPHAAAAGADVGADSDEEPASGAGGAEQPGHGAGRHSSGGGAGGSGRTRQRLRPLMRPIICICNDLYAPALRPLRDVALVFHFKKPQAERLTQRLQAICAAQGLRCEKSTLRLLVERTECDIRSCLNTLQFLAKKQSVVRQADLAGLGVGQKDMTKGAFQVWTELLQKKKAPGIIGRAAETDAQRGARLYGMLQDFGEAELVLGGVHENVLGLRYFDMALQRTTAVLNHLGDADAFMRACSRTNDFGLLKYAPAPLVALSSQVAGPDRPNLQWPRASFDAHRRAAANAALLQGWMLGMTPAAVAAASTRNLVLEVLPHLMHIAAPCLRPVSQHLYSPAEQEAVRSLVDTLLHYNLRYCLDHTAEDAEEEARQLEADAAAEGGDAAAVQQRIRGVPSEPPLRFRPAVHRACAFPGMAVKGKHLPAAVRQTVSHEADMEAIRRAEVTRWGSLGGSASATAMEADSTAQAAVGAPLGQANAQASAQRPGAGGIVPLTLAERLKLAQRQSGAAGAAQKRDRPAHKGTWLDQLKEQRQARAAAAAGGGEAAGGAGKARFAVLYRFHEGVTNAVKRGVLMRDLLA